MKSSEYFAKRSEMRMKKAHDRANPVMNSINRAFSQSEKRLKHEIKKLTKNFEDLEPKDIRNKLEEHITYDRYQDLLQLYKTTENKKIKSDIEKIIKANIANYRIKRKEALLQAINIERLAMADVTLYNTTKHLENIYKDTMIANGLVDVSKEMIDEVLKNKWMGANYSSRIWNNQKVLAKKLEINLLEGFISGKPNKQIVDEITYLTDVGRHVANRLVRTETSYMVNVADLESSKRRGIKAKKFEANLDSRTSKICREHNQRIIPIDKIRIGVNAPPLHPYCRSFLSDLLEGWDYETDEELEELIANSEKENKKSLEKYNKDITDGQINKYRKPDKDVEQYLRYKDTIKAEKFGLTFEEFKEIKYNKGEEYDLFKLDYKTTSAINKNNKIIDKSRAIDLYYAFRDENLVASDHFIEQFIDREIDKKGNRKFNFNKIVNLAKYEPNYMDSRNNRFVIFEDKISIIKENNRLVTIRYGRGSKHWEKI